MIAVGLATGEVLDLDRPVTPLASLVDRRTARRLAGLVDSLVVADGGIGCWLWTGDLDRDGYGLFVKGGRILRAHRVAYVRLRGDMARGLDLDHLCRVRSCVNPAHLEPATRGTNRARVGLPPFARVYAP